MWGPTSSESYSYTRKAFGGKLMRWEENKSNLNLSTEVKYWGWFQESSLKRYWSKLHTHHPYTWGEATGKLNSEEVMICFQVGYVKSAVKVICMSGEASLNLTWALLMTGQAAFGHLYDVTQGRRGGLRGGEREGALTGAVFFFVSGLKLV